MKKILALVLALMLCCACAFAEEAEVYSYAFDPAMAEGIEGEFIAFEDLGLQVFIPANFGFLEPSEADVARGVNYVLAADDGSMSMSITVAGVADAEGNLITDVEGLAAFYAASGVTEMEIAYFNEMPALYYILYLNEIPYANLALATTEGYFISFSIITSGEELPAAIASVMISSIMPYIAE